MVRGSSFCGPPNPSYLFVSRCVPVAQRSKASCKLAASYVYLVTL